MRSIIKIISVLLCITSLSGCCSIMLGPRQQVGISSTPTGAKVSVDNHIIGNTPIIKNLARNNTHVVKIEMNGYMPKEIILTQKVSGWVWGNIVFGGLIGLVVDAISGAMYILTPEQINEILLKENAGYLYNKNTIYVAVVLDPNPSWGKIGQLEKLK